MLENFQLLRNVGQFDSVATGAQYPLTKLSLIYAENGRGKTTLAAELDLGGAWVEYANLLSQLRQAAETLKTGEVQEVSVNSERVLTLMRLISGTTKPNEAASELVSGPVVWRESVRTRDSTVTPIDIRRRQT